MLKHLRPALVLLVLFTLLTGIVYPFAITGIGQVLFRNQAEGSPITRDGAVIGSKLIGQRFSQPAYFWGRPSAAGNGYDARASAGSNFGPSSKALADRIKAEAERLGRPSREIPTDLLTTSGSGLDPHISPAAARFQARRVAEARGLSEATISQLVEAHVEKPAIGFIGESRVNVLELNLALDALSRTTLP